MGGWIACDAMIDRKWVTDSTPNHSHVCSINPNVVDQAGHKRQRLKRFSAHLWNEKIISFTYSREERYVRVAVNGWPTITLNDIGNGQILYPCVVLSRERNDQVHIVHHSDDESNNPHPADDEDMLYSGSATCSSEPLPALRLDSE